MMPCMTSAVDALGGVDGGGVAERSMLGRSRGKRTVQPDRSVPRV